MKSTITKAWAGSNGSDLLSSSITIEGGTLADDVDMSDLDEIDVEIQWTENNVKIIFILCPFAVRLRFNYDTTPQDFEVMAGGCFEWDLLSGIDCPVTGNVDNLRVTRLNPTEPSVSDIIPYRITKDSTPS